MADQRLLFFPLPIVSAGSRQGGALIPEPQECADCPDRECEAPSVIGELSLCKYGFRFLRLAEDLLAYGFLVANESAQSKRHRQRLREYGRTALHADELSQLRATMESALRQEEAHAENLVLAQESLILGDAAAQTELVERLKPQIQQSAGQLHDYLDLAAQILKQLNVYMGVRYPHIQVPDALDHAPDELQSIYWLARLMEEKVAAFGYYLNPESVREEEDTFRLHGVVTKYKKMYERACHQKSVRVEIGADYSSVRGNRDALGVLVHSIFDNAVKYAPSRSTIRVELESAAAEPLVTFSVISLGPKMTDAERTRIFLPFVRGDAAQAHDTEGMGFGLAFAQRIAAEYGRHIRVAQTGSPQRGSYETAFAYEFDRA